MDYREEDKRVQQQLIASEHSHNWAFDPGDPSVGIWPGWYCEYYNENLGGACEALPTDEEIEELWRRQAELVGLEY